MKRRVWGGFFGVLAVFGLALAGCLVESRQPVGETPASIKAEEWEGTWVSTILERGTMALEVKDASQGILLMMEKGVNERDEVYLRASGDWLFASWRKEGDPENNFTWVRIENWAMENRGRVLLVWRPNVEKSAALVDAGELPGEVKPAIPEKIDSGVKVVLGQLGPKDYQVMKNKEWEIFEFVPLVFVRLAKQSPE